MSGLKSSNLCVMGQWSSVEPTLYKCKLIRSCQHLHGENHSSQWQYMTSYALDSEDMMVVGSIFLTNFGSNLEIPFYLEPE